MRKARQLSLRWGGEQIGAPFSYDAIDRRSFDAVVVVPHFRAPYADREGRADGVELDWVVLRSAVRPPVLFRDTERFKGLPGGAGAILWEVPAGLVEPTEENEAGLSRAAARELFEEVGFLLEPEKIEGLGPPTYPCPGVIGERQYFFHARVELAARQEPPLDGSALEAVGELVAVPLRAALAACAEQGAIDMKTEIALRRLLEKLG